MSIEKTELTGVKFIDNIFFDHDINRYGIISFLLLFVGCGGGIAVGLGALDSTFQLILLVTSTMLALSLILAVAPMKFIVYTSIIACTIDIIMIAFNTLT